MSQANDTILQIKILNVISIAEEIASKGLHLERCAYLKLNNPCNCGIVKLAIALMNLRGVQKHILNKNNETT